MWFDFLSVLVVFVFKLLLSLFWLCEEAQCVYLRLHLGRKPNFHQLKFKLKWPYVAHGHHTGQYSPSVCALEPPHFLVSD